MTAINPLVLQRADKASSFSTLALDLSDVSLRGPTMGVAGVGGSGAVFVQLGYGLRFLRRGSMPGARFLLRLGGAVQSFSPGDRIDAPQGFDQFTLELAPECNHPNVAQGNLGFAYVVVLHQPGLDFREAEAPDTLPPILLLGATSLPVDTDPGVGATVGFSVKGWRAIRLWVNAGYTASDTNVYPCPSFDVVLWQRDQRIFSYTALDATAATGLISRWANPPTVGGLTPGRISFDSPDVNQAVAATAPYWRCVTVPVDGAGEMAVSIRNAVSDAADPTQTTPTALVIAVQGVY